MPRNNIKLLNGRQLYELNEKFIFTHDDDFIYVHCTDYGRVTSHPINMPFHINCKGIRKVCFNMSAINIWKELDDSKISLFLIQNIVNKLQITYQDISLENVKKLLEKDTIIKLK